VTDFVDRFSKEINSNRNQIKQDIDSDLDIELLDRMKEIFSQNYTSKEIEKKKEDFQVIATDAGRNDIELKNNSRIYILQAAGVDSKGSISREIDVGSLKSFKQQDYESFLQRGSEVVEIQSVLEALENVGGDEKVYVLIDGTLLTRLLVTPEPLDLSRGRLKRIELMEQFQKLVEEARENENLILAGVSKDSNSSLLYRKLLGDMIESEVDDLEVEELEEVGEEDRKFLRENFHRIRYSPEEVRQNLENLEQAGADAESINRIRSLVEQYRTRFSDTEVIEEMTDEPGFTEPLRIGRIKPDFFSRMEEFEDKGKNFVEEELKKDFQDEKTEMSTEKICEVLENVLKSPGVASFYWKPSRHDSPLRIDLLNHDMDETDLMSCEDQKFIEAEEKVKDILELLETGYAGEGMHNVWISQADNSASLKNGDVENIYKPVLEKNLGINLRNYMRRRDKRV
jgi:hypothetical protein